MILAALLRKFNGLVGKEVQPGRRLGTEFSDRAKTAGVGGIFHTDELPNYGITEKEVQAVRDAIGAGPRDAVIMVADEPEKARLAIEAVINRQKKPLRESLKKPEKLFLTETLLICAPSRVQQGCTQKPMFPR